MDRTNSKIVRLMAYAFITACGLAVVFVAINMVNVNLKMTDIKQNYVPPVYVVTPTITPRPIAPEPDILTIKENLTRDHLYREITIIKIDNGIVLGKYDDRDENLKKYTMVFLASVVNHKWTYLSETKSTWDCEILTKNNISVDLISELDYNFQRCEEFGKKFGFGGFYKDYIKQQSTSSAAILK